MTNDQIASDNFQCAPKWSIMIYITELNSLKSDQLESYIFSIKTISPTKCETRWHSLKRLGLLQWKTHGNHEIMWTFSTAIISYPVFLNSILESKHSKLPCFLCQKKIDVLFTMKRVNNEIYKCNDIYIYMYNIYIARIQLINIFKIKKKKKKTITIFFSKSWAHSSLELKIHPVPVESHKYWNHKDRMAQYKIYNWFHSNISITYTSRQQLSKNAPQWSYLIKTQNQIKFL